MNRLDCPGGGVLLLSAFPGLSVKTAPSGRRATIEAGVKAIAAADAKTMITLVEAPTLAQLGVADFRDLVRGAGMNWLHLPIEDFSVPGDAFRERWRRDGPAVHARLDRGETVAIHCRAGLGRTGTVAAMILIERGAAPEEAVRLVRRARPGTIETPEQSDWVAAYRGARA